MKYDAIIWDMDGTLLYTLEDLQTAVNHVLRQYELPERSLEQICAAVGNGVVKLMELSVPDGKDDPRFPQMMEEFTAYYEKHCTEKTRPYDGVIPVMKELRAQGIKMAVASNKPAYGVKALSDLYFEGLLDVAMGVSESLRRKPAPDMVWKAIEQLGLTRERSVYIGDSDVDFATAKNAGLDCISVLWGFRDEAFLRGIGASTFAKTPADLLELMK
ncbi:MAG: HAD-IA family hydrolase [Clostridia bacterium]|nr:HAD-IA family hydrolase [Clostridia bacterium]